MDTKTLADAKPESLQRSSPFVIVSYMIRGFAITAPGKIFALLFKGSSGAVLALYVLSALQTFGVHWFIRLLVVCFCVLLVQLVISLYKYFTLKFRYDENKISAKKGLFAQELQEFDSFNVRSFQLTRSALQRRLNLASVSLATAGSSDNTIEIPYIPYSLALDWEKRVKNQELHTDAREATDAETGALPAESEETNEEQPRKLLHRLNPRTLARASLANGNILSDALFGCTVLGAGYFLYRFIYQILNLAPNIFEVEDADPIQVFRSQVSSTIGDLPTNFVADTTSLAEAFQQFTGLAVAQSLHGKILFFTSLSLVLVIAFYVVNRIRYVVGNYDFELTQRGIHLQAEDGLMKKRRLTIRRDRVQTTSFRTNFVERMLNRGNVDLDSASKMTCRIPFVTREHADHILRLVNDEAHTPVPMSPFSQRFTPIHVLSFFKQFVLQDVFFLPFALIPIYIFYPGTRGLIWPYSLLLFVYAAVKAFVRWRKEGYIVSDDFLLQREGGFGWWSVKVAPLRKVQSMSIKQSWLQRLRNRATIKFHYASGEQLIPFLKLSIAEAMQRTVEEGIRGDRDTGDEFVEDESVREWKSLPQKYIVSRVIGKIFTSIVVLIPLFYLIARATHAWLSVSYELLAWVLAITWVAVVGWRVVVVCLKIPKYRYAYGKHDLVAKESFIATQTETVRYSRLQTVSTSNSLIDGFFGLSDLYLYTAESEVSVHGLHRREATKLREYIANRMIDISSTGSDALTMTEQPTSSVDSDDVEIAPDQTTLFTDSIGKSDTFQWKKFNGWALEIIMPLALILLYVPGILMIVGVIVWAVEMEWAAKFDESLFGFVHSWYSFFGTWLILSLWIGSGPFIEIPRKGYCVSADALRYKSGWLRRGHDVVPLSRIQNVTVSATILARVFDMKAVKVSTGSKDEITLAYLSDTDAEDLRAQLLRE